MENRYLQIKLNPNGTVASWDAGKVVTQYSTNFKIEIGCIDKSMDVDYFYIQFEDSGTKKLMLPRTDHTIELIEGKTFSYTLTQADVAKYDHIKNFTIVVEDGNGSQIASNTFNFNMKKATYSVYQPIDDTTAKDLAKGIQTLARDKQDVINSITIDYKLTDDGKITHETATGTITKENFNLLKASKLNYVIARLIELESVTHTEVLRYVKEYEYNNTKINDKDISNVLDIVFTAKDDGSAEYNLKLIEGSGNQELKLETAELTGTLTQEQYDFLIYNNNRYILVVGEKTRKFYFDTETTTTRQYISTEQESTQYSYVLTINKGNKNWTIEKKEAGTKVIPYETEQVGEHKQLVDLKVDNVLWRANAKELVFSSTFPATPKATLRAIWVKNDDGTYSMWSLPLLAGSITDYEALSKKPLVNGVELIGNITLTQLNIYNKEEVRNLLATGRAILQVETLPLDPNPNTVYYVGTTSPYRVYLVDSTGKIVDLGTSEVDLTQYQKKLTAGFGINIDTTNTIKIDIDKKTIVTDENNKLKTAVGGYDNRQSKAVYDGSLSKVRSYVGEAQFNATSVVVLENGWYYSGKLTGNGIETTFNNSPVVRLTSKHSTELWGIYIGQIEDAPLYFGYDDIRNLNFIFTTPESTVNAFRWNNIVNNITHIEISAKTGELSLINNKFINIDNDTIKVNADGKLFSAGGVDIDGKTIIKGDDGKIKTSIGAYDSYDKTLIMDGSSLGTPIANNFIPVIPTTAGTITELNEFDLVKGTLEAMGETVEFDGICVNVGILVGSEIKMITGLNVTGDNEMDVYFGTAVQDGAKIFVLASGHIDLTEVGSISVKADKITNREVKKVAGKYVEIDNETIGIDNAGQLRVINVPTTIIDEKSIVLSNENQLEVSYGGHFLSKTELSFDGNTDFSGKFAYLDNFIRFYEGDYINCNLDINNFTKGTGILSFNFNETASAFTFNGYHGFGFVFNNQTIEGQTFDICFGTWFEKNGDIKMGVMLDKVLTSSDTIGIIVMGYYAETHDISQIKAEVIPIDNVTIYQENGKLKASAKGEGYTKEEADTRFVPTNLPSAIVGKKIFSQPVQVGLSSEYTLYRANGIDHSENGDVHSYTYPLESGEFALTSMFQTFYNGIYPVNSIVFGLQAPGVPDGINATWTDVSSSYNGRYFKVDSSVKAGTSQAESITIAGTNLTANQMPAHTHGRGTMEITGGLTADRFGRGDTIESSGCFKGSYNTTRSGKAASNYDNTNANLVYINFKASDNWTGDTSSTGDGQAHTHSASGVKPLTTTIKVWKRTA